MKKIMRRVVLPAALAIALCLSATAYAEQCAHKGICEYVSPSSHICSLCAAELPHAFVARVVSATCSAVGYTMDVCTACAYEGAQYDIVPVDPFAHVFHDWTVVAKPTCARKGLRERQCVLCGWTQTEEMAMTAHTVAPVVHAPDCRNDGYTEQVCSVCGAVTAVGDVVPRSAAYHRWSEFIVIVQPGCETEGEQERVCLTCGAKHRQTLPATGHTPSVATYPPDCVNDGYTVSVCRVCGLELGARHSPVPHGAAYHRFGDWTQIAAATCASQGERVRYCTVCRTSETAAVPPIAHDPVERVVPATFRADGYTVQVCRRCAAETGARYAFVPAGMYTAVAEETPAPGAPVTGAATAVLRTAVSGQGEVVRTLALVADDDCPIALDAKNVWFADNGVDALEIVAQGVLLRTEAEGRIYVEVRSSRTEDGLQFLVRTNLSNAGFDETAGAYGEDHVYRVTCGDLSETALYGCAMTVLLPAQAATCAVATVRLD